MPKRSVYKGHASEWKKPVAARDTLGRGAGLVGVAGTRNGQHTPNNASMPNSLKRGSYGINGSTYIAEKK
jgi:hypothetical protein